MSRHSTALAHSAGHGLRALRREVAFRYAEVQVMGSLEQLVPHGGVGCLAGKMAQLLGRLLAHLDTIRQGLMGWHGLSPSRAVDGFQNRPVAWL